jgi:N-carbamoylputrescine amidase
MNTPIERKSSMSSQRPGRVRVGLVQMSCATNKEDNVAKAADRIGEAAAAGANVVCLQELFAGHYPCQSEDHARFGRFRDRPASGSRGPRARRGWW